MPSTGIGVYLDSDSLSAGDEVSSTYEGRHLTFLASDITGQIGALVGKGEPVVIGEHIVGVAFKTEVAGTDLIPIDTEGIWALSVVATDEDGNVAVVAGDELFIHKTTAVISKNYNKQSHTRFGYALGGITSGSTFVIAVKIHWNPSDALELVGTTAAPETSAKNDQYFREYRLESSGSGSIHGDYMRLNIASAVTNAIGGRSNLAISAVAAQAYGRHDTVSIKSTGSITGLAVGHRAGYLASDAAQAGTIAGAMSELWAEGASTDFGGATHSIHRFVMDGDGTGRATADNVFEFVNLSSVQYVANTDTPTRGLQVIINGVVRWIMVSEATS